MPADPQGQQLCTRVQQRSYPVIERNGIIFAYLGSGRAAELPALDCFVAPDSHVFAFKGYLDCNWLQALEVGLDPAHASFLHRFFEDADASANYGRQFRATSADSDMPMTRVLREFERPTISVHSSDTGLQIFALRDIGGGNSHVRVTNLVFPQAFVIPLSAEMTITQWHVPIDDQRCYWYALFTSFTTPVDKDEMRRQRLQLYTLPDYMPRVGRFNNYGYDFDQQQRATYTGMGDDINVHDQWAVESQGTDPGPYTRASGHHGQGDRGVSQAADERDQESGARRAHASSAQCGRGRARNGPWQRWTGLAPPPNGRAIGARWIRGGARARHGIAGERRRPLSFIARHDLWNADQRRAAEEVNRRIEADRIELVRLSFPDLHGILARQGAVGRGDAGRHARRVHGHFDAAAERHVSPHCRACLLGRRGAGPGRSFRAVATS